jgi:hypothetical protein
MRSLDAASSGCVSHADMSSALSVVVAMGGGLRAWSAVLFFGSAKNGTHDEVLNAAACNAGERLEPFAFLRSHPNYDAHMQDHFRRAAHRGQPVGFLRVRSVTRVFHACPHLVHFQEGL